MKVSAAFDNHIIILIIKKRLFLNESIPLYNNNDNEVLLDTSCSNQKEDCLILDINTFVAVSCSPDTCSIITERLRRKSETEPAGVHCKTKVHQDLSSQRVISPPFSCDFNHFSGIVNIINIERWINVKDCLKVRCASNYKITKWRKWLLSIGVNEVWSPTHDTKRKNIYIILYCGHILFCFHDIYSFPHFS